jgi:hypothetical protein
MKNNIIIKLENCIVYKDNGKIDVEISLSNIRNILNSHNSVADQVQQKEKKFNDSVSEAITQVFIEKQGATMPINDIINFVIPKIKDSDCFKHINKVSKIHFIKHLVKKHIKENSGVTPKSTFFSCKNGIARWCDNFKKLYNKMKEKKMKYVIFDDYVIEADTVSEVEKISWECVRRDLDYVDVWTCPYDDIEEAIENNFEGCYKNGEKIFQPEIDEKKHGKKQRLEIKHSTSDKIESYNVWVVDEDYFETNNTKNCLLPTKEELSPYNYDDICFYIEDGILKSGGSHYPNNGEWMLYSEL